MPPLKMLFLCKTLHCSLEELVLAVELAGKDPVFDQSQKEEKQLIAA
jgi:hypothetical protein